MKQKSNDFSQKTRVFLINQNETPNWKTLYILIFYFEKKYIPDFQFQKL